MTATPWGEAERLSARKLPPGPGGDREEIARQQRERLFGAMVAVVADKGYETTRVEDVLVLAGVSRNAFYKLFTSKQDCFVRMLEELAQLFEPAMEAVVGEAPGSWDRRLRALLDAVAELLIAQPAMARAAWVEVYAAGAGAIEVVERIDRSVEAVVAEALDESPERRGMPRDVMRALVGAVRKLVHDRVRTDRIDTLPELMDDVFEWLHSYRTPPEPLRRPPRVPPQLRAQAPEATDSRERILAAVTDLVAEKGYPKMAITEIANRAAVSLTTFYQHFDGKEAAFLETFWQGHLLVLETVSRRAAGRDWEHGMRAAIRAYTACLATLPALAALGGVGVWATSPRAIELRAQSIEPYKAALDEGFRLYPATPPAARDGIAAAIDALLFDTVRHHGAERLYELAPTATFVALAPFVGAERACELANGELTEPALRG